MSESNLFELIEVVIDEKYRRVNKAYVRATKMDKKQRLGAKLTVLRQLKNEYRGYLKGCL